MSDRYPLWESLVAPSDYGRPESTAVRADGVRIQFADGRWALCATSGLWNVNLGYGNPAITQAVTSALTDASYLSLFRYGHLYAVDAARALLDVCGPDHFGRVIFSTSGSAANDLVMKLARQYWALRGEPGRSVIVGLKGSYHGLTYGSFALSGEDLGQRAYGVDQRLVRHVRHDDESELASVLAREGHRVAAVVVEPVLGSGAHALPATMIAALGRLRDEHGFLLVADEVATGFGRTGPFFASSDWVTQPDLLVTSKGLTNGTCGAAAVVASHEVCERFERSDAVLVHGETQAGAPATCAAIMATIEEMVRLRACERAVQVSAGLDHLLDQVSAHPLVVGQRGVGCFRALQLAGPNGPLTPEDVRTVVAATRECGAVIQPGPSSIQLVPALVYAREELQELQTSLLHGLDRTAEVVLR